MRYNEAHFLANQAVMPTLGSAAVREAVQKVLAQDAGTAADAKTLAQAAVRVYTRLTQQLAPLIGEAGVGALTTRSLHLAQREFPWLAEARDPQSPDTAFAQVGSCLERQAPAAVMEAVGALLATFCGLLAALIGDTLATRLVLEAWPSAFPDDSTEGSQQ